MKEMQFFLVMRTEPMAFYMQDKNSATEPLPQGLQNAILKKTNFGEVTI